jgi:hypothetical protein
MIIYLKIDVFFKLKLNLKNNLLTAVVVNKGGLFRIFSFDHSAQKLREYEISQN